MHKEELEQLTPEVAFGRLATSPVGLTHEEVKKRIVQYGENILKKEQGTTLKIISNQFTSSLVYLLIGAAAVSFYLKDTSDGIAITVILVINALLGFLQEFRSEKAVEKLSKLISKQILVKRNGTTSVVDERTLVPGDIVILREGDIIPADIKLFEADNFSVNESELTGESLPVYKTQSALVFAGSVVERGDGKGIVYATAHATELGKIAHLSGSTKKATKYEKSLKDFSTFLMRVIFLTLAIVFIAKLIITHDISHISRSLLFIMALAITVIPEALPVIAIVTLSEGALRLAKKHVIVKRLSSLEDLGNVDLLCTDKTGTLTENVLSIKNIVSQNVVFFEQLACASVEDFGIKKRKSQNSFDAAFLNYIPKQIQKQVTSWKQLKYLPFDPVARRRRVVIVDPHKNIHYLVVLGSAETVLEISMSTEKKEMLKKVAEDGMRGIRHLAIAYKEIAAYTNDFNILEHEHDLLFAGYVELIDPLRPTAQLTIERAEKLGITIKILTGDSKEVAEYIGRQIGLLSDSSKVYTGDDIASMSDDEVRKAVEVCSVFARINPEQKYTIIKLLKEKYTVGYQGDGINDAPSLKLADVGIAVNNATDVAKDSADIVLLKGDLAVIVDGIHYGRGIFVNINKYIKHTMVGNLGNFFSLAIVYLIAADLPLLPLQLLVANLIQDIPLITVYSDNVDSVEVKKPETYNIHSVMFISLFLGTFSGLYDFIYFIIIGFNSTVQTQTNLFLFLTFTQLMIIFSVRNKDHFWIGKRPSLLVTSSVILFLLLSIALTCIPITARFFSFTPLPFTTLGLLLIITALYIFILDYIKVWYFSVVEDKKR